VYTRGDIRVDLEGAVTDAVGREGPDEDTLIELEGVPDFRADPLADSIASSDLRRVLESLDPTDRALIALRYVAELSSDEIGRALGMSSSGARGRLSRLLLRLRDLVDNALPAPLRHSRP